MYKMLIVIVTILFASLIITNNDKESINQKAPIVSQDVEVKILVINSDHGNYTDRSLNALNDVVVMIENDPQYQTKKNFDFSSIEEVESYVTLNNLIPIGLIRDVNPYFIISGLAVFAILLEVYLHRKN